MIERIKAERTKQGLVGLTLVTSLIFCGAVFLLPSPALGISYIYVCSSDPDCPSCPSGKVCADVWQKSGIFCTHVVNDFACVSSCDSDPWSQCERFCPPWLFPQWCS